MSELKFGFLGGGQMATAIARGAVQAGVAVNEDIAFCDTNAAQNALLVNNDNMIILYLIIHL